MRPIQSFRVVPSLPDNLEPLRRLAFNLYWDWAPDLRELFRRLDRDLWETCHHNPVALLGSVSQERLQEAAEDEGFLSHLERSVKSLDQYLHERTWYRKQRHPEAGRPECYAYFSAEFGLTESLPIYSGGLGVLAGDHLKSASDLGLPLVGIGLLYQEGYFSQYFNADGWQQERYPINDFYNLPLHLMRRPDGSELRIEVPYPQRVIYARVWRVDVGAVPLYLLDTNIEPNNAYDQNITDQLYGGDLDLRIHQEIMLGIGGIKLLRALGLHPTVYHLNEGHSAFLSLERMREFLQEDGLSFTEARELVKSSQIFTTHTPVPAGIDLFPADTVMYYLGNYAQVLGLGREEFLSLGRENTGDFQTPFNMAIFAIRMASFVNGVSQLHAEVSRHMFAGLWPGVPLGEVPIAGVTNGVHARSCVAPAIQEVYEQYLGPNWWTLPPEHFDWHQVESIPDEELWRQHERVRFQMIQHSREKLQQALRERGAPLVEVTRAGEALDPKALTLGFARRFATYKRANLLLRQPERFKRLLMDREHPLQLVFAGKAHPKDNPGKDIIRQIIHFARENGLEKQFIFIPNYDIYTSRLLVAGCDLWLNTPRRPREASGTSGMKAAMNGLPNLSTLDGWWAEADYVNTGWAIGRGEEYANQDYQDEVEANALYQVLEEEVIPQFYHRDAEGLPRTWIARMKQSIRLNTPLYNTTRMVKEYARRAYFPTHDRYQILAQEHYQGGKTLAAWKSRIFQEWYNIRIQSVDATAPHDLQVNAVVEVKAVVNLGQISPEDVVVQLYQGPVEATGEISQGRPADMVFQGQDDWGNSLYVGEVAFSTSGLQGFSVRILPHHPYLGTSVEMGLIHWAA
ncbi:MAG: alpha-glucan family phosphorylase [Gloeomargaritaceae cyanobacterium C42_A2020_066]|nr:alpha-glucan family phosphorylase [Gloeomargaritaceae cyanobacterium C42_A2020_066]